MAKTYDTIDEELAGWIGRQHVFFTATAPMDGGHVNCSPKGLDTLRIMGPLRVAYLDLTGSGAETAAHLRDDGRIVLMFCAFEGPPRIVRLHGRGSVLQAGEAPFAELLPCFEPLSELQRASARSIVTVDVERVSSSCGYGVPAMRYEGLRPQMDAWAVNRLKRDGSDGLIRYQAENNARSIDGLPALEPRLAASTIEDSGTGGR